MNAMIEAAFQYRSLYLLCSRSRDMLVHLSSNALKQGELDKAQRLVNEAAQVGAESYEWYLKWEQAGGRTHAPLKTHLPLRSPPLAEVSKPDLSNVIIFPVERCRRAG